MHNYACEVLPSFYVNLHLYEVNYVQEIEVGLAHCHSYWCGINYSACKLRVELKTMEQLSDLEVGQL